MVANVKEWRSWILNKVRIWKEPLIFRDFLKNIGKLREILGHPVEPSEIETSAILICRVTAALSYPTLSYMKHSALHIVSTVDSVH
jgi:hypothetical protein